MKMRFKMLVFCCAFAICVYSGNNALAEVCFVVGGCNTGSSQNVDDCSDLGFHSTTPCKAGASSQETCNSQGRTYYKCGCPADYNLSDADKATRVVNGTHNNYDWTSSTDGITGKKCWKATCKTDFIYLGSKTVTVDGALYIDGKKDQVASQAVSITGSGVSCDGMYKEYKCPEGWGKNKGSDLYYQAQCLTNGIKSKTAACYKDFDCQSIDGYLNRPIMDKSSGWKTTEVTVKSIGKVTSFSSGIYGSKTCYKKVAKTCADHNSNYQSDNTCSDKNMVASDKGLFLLGDERKRCYTCVADCSPYYDSKDACVAQLAVKANENKPAYCKQRSGECSGKWELIETAGSCPINFQLELDVFPYHGINSSVEEKYLPRGLFASAVDIFKAVFGVNDAMAQQPGNVNLDPCERDEYGRVISGDCSGTGNTHEMFENNGDGGGTGGSATGAWTGCKITDTSSADFYNCYLCDNGKYNCMWKGHDCTDYENNHYLWKDGPDGHKVCMHCYFGTLTEVTTNGQEDDTLCQAENSITCAEKYGAGYYDTIEACVNYIKNNSTSVSDEKNYLECKTHGAIQMVHMCYKPFEKTCENGGSTVAPGLAFAYSETKLTNASKKACYNVTGCREENGYSSVKPVNPSETLTEGGATCYKGGCTPVEENGKVYCQQCQCATECFSADNCGINRITGCASCTGIVLSSIKNGKLLCMKKSDGCASGASTCANPDVCTVTNDCAKCNAGYVSDGVNGLGALKCKLTCPTKCKYSTQGSHCTNGSQPVLSGKGQCASCDSGYTRSTNDEGLAVCTQTECPSGLYPATKSNGLGNACICFAANGVDIQTVCGSKKIWAPYNGQVAFDYQNKKAGMRDYWVANTSGRFNHCGAVTIAVENLIPDFQTGEYIIDTNAGLKDCGNGIDTQPITPNDPNDPLGL